jgi:hypothetical protein
VGLVELMGLLDALNGLVLFINHVSR